MRALLQRVKNARVELEDDTISGSIQLGILILLGIESEDSEMDLDYLVQKILKLRIFDDASGVMNLSVADIGGELLIVSQFTLYASTNKGNRPSYIQAARPEIAIPLYEKCIDKLSNSGLKVATGVFGAMMQVHLQNDGPVTIWLDSKNK